MYSYSFDQQILCCLPSNSLLGSWYYQSVNNNCVVNVCVQVLWTSRYAFDIVVRTDTWKSVFILLGLSSRFSTGISRIPVTSGHLDSFQWSRTSSGPDSSTRVSKKIISCDIVFLEPVKDDGPDLFTELQRTDIHFDTIMIDQYVFDNFQHTTASYPHDSLENIQCNAYV